jgi:phage FluMu protein Com
MPTGRFLAAKCPNCQELVPVCRYPYPDPLDFDPALIVEIKCSRCKKTFRLLARNLQVIEEGPKKPQSS